MATNPRSVTRSFREHGLMTVLTLDDVLAIRMRSLLLAKREARSPADVVTWMGAMQAQDVSSGEWSFGARCEGMTQTDIRQATVDRQILRTWPMRGTVHFVPPADAKWMLEVTGVRALAGSVGRREQLGLTEPILNRGVAVLHDALAGGCSLTRPKCVQLLLDAGVHSASEHGYHLLLYASLIGVTCIGPQQGKDQTFVLLNEWVPNPNVLSRDEALATLAARYFRSHGPASRSDFVGWTGLTVTDAKRGIELASETLRTIDTASGPMVAAIASLDYTAVPATRNDDLLLLPAFDEYLLGYKDRNAMISPERMNQIIPGANGVFKPTIVANGRVIGTWKRTAKTRHVEIQAFPFAPFTTRQRQEFARACGVYADYLQLEPKIM
jgi:Winged helix DNA-binding domain